MIKKLFIVFIASFFSLISFGAIAKTTVTWWGETNADRDPVFIENWLSLLMSRKMKLS